MFFAEISQSHHTDHDQWRERRDQSLTGGVHEVRTNSLHHQGHSNFIPTPKSHSYQLQRFTVYRWKNRKIQEVPNKGPNRESVFFLFNSADPEKTCPDVPILKSVFQVTGEQKQIEEDKVPRETIS